MATIRERRPGVWEVRTFTGYDERGRPTQVSRTVHGTKKDAKHLAAQMTVKPNRKAGGKKVADLLEDWIETKAPIWAPLTLRDHQSRAAHIQDDPIARSSVASLSVSDIDRWVSRMRKAGVGESAITNRHSALRAALQQAVRWELIDHNPATNAPVQRPKRLHREAMTAEEVHQVLEAAKQVNEFAALALRLAAETGARRGELAALSWDSLVDDRLVVDRQVTLVQDDDGKRRPEIRPTKTGSRRAVALGPSTLAMVQAQAQQWAHLTVWMFGPDTEPVNPDRIGWWWRRAREIAGINTHWRLHDLRHWSATHAIASGADMRTVANRLGHVDPSMTLRVYSHAVRQADESLARSLGQALDGEV